MAHSIQPSITIVDVIFSKSITLLQFKPSQINIPLRNQFLESQASQARDKQRQCPRSTKYFWYQA